MKISIKKAITESIPVALHMNIHQVAGYEPSPEAVLLASSRDWLLARSLGDGLDPDGYWAVSRRHVLCLQTSKSQAYRKKVLEIEEAWHPALEYPKIDLTSAATILSHIQQEQGFAIVLRETAESWHSIHCRIDKVTVDHALLHGFDGAGQWERRPLRVNLSEITRIRFGSRYLGLYKKHISKC